MCFCNQPDIVVEASMLVGRYGVIKVSYDISMALLRRPGLVLHVQSLH